jgi:hypothetical protein
MPKFKNKILLITSVLLVALVFLPLKAAADPVVATTCPKGTAHPPGSTTVCELIKKPSDCASGQAGLIVTVNGVQQIDKTQCVPLGNGCATTTEKACLQNNPIVKRLNEVLVVLSALVGLIIIGSLIVAGIQYSVAGSNAQAVSAAKQRLINAFIALAAFISIFALLQWLVPGGVF